MGQSTNERISWDEYLAPPADFAGADDVINNLAKYREPRIEIIERTPLSLIVTSFQPLLLFKCSRQ